MGMKRALIILSIIFALGSLLNGCSTESSLISPSLNVTYEPTLEPTATESVTTAPIEIDPEETESIVTDPPATESVEAKPIIEGNLRVHFLDVGQGDSTFIELPSGETMLIDAGESQYGSTIVHYLEARGYTSIDYLIATHPHADHIGGMAYVVDNLEIKSIYIPKAQANTNTFENLLTTIQDKGLKIDTAKAGVNLFDYDNLRADIIAPNGDDYTDLNNFSAVIKLIYGDTSFLFMGDAEYISENEITTDVDVDVLKIGHHGSAYSSGQSFLEKVSPSIAVISVGEGNNYGHPAQETLDRLKQVNTDLLRTDIHGTIKVSSDGNALSYSSNKDGDPWTTTSTETPQISDGNAQISPDVGEGITVYVTRTGSKYHCDGCHYLSQSQIPMLLEEAIAAGYGPCSKCDPPTLKADEQSLPVITTAPTEEPTQNTSQDIIVYVTKTGSKYHVDGCQYLSKSQIPIYLSDAIAQGYTPCSKCNPPT